MDKIGFVLYKESLSSCTGEGVQNNGHAVEDEEESGLGAAALESVRFLAVKSVFYDIQIEA